MRKIFAYKVMGLTPKWSKRDLTMGIALCAALVSLAILQYQWIGQVGEAKRKELDSNRQASIRRLTDDFNGELERLAQLLVGGGPPVTPGEGTDSLRPAAEPSLEDVEAHLQSWRASTRHPQLVKQIYEVIPGNLGMLPPQLANLAGRIPGVGSTREDLNRPGGGGSLLVDGDVPALAMPMKRTRPGVTVDRWMIVEFSMPYMREYWLPDLITRNFSSDFEVMIVRSTDGDIDNHAILLKNVIYGSKIPEAAKEPGDAEAQGKQLAELPTEADRGNIFQVRFGPDGRGRRGGFNGGPSDRPPPDDRRGKEGKTKGFRGRGPSDDSPDGPRFQGFGGPGGDRPAGTLPWHILASYKSGPLDATVNSLRRRNLAVSFGILMLTGVSVAMLMFSSRRASALAQQQMEFVAGVTHELRTPLAVISSASQNLADGITTSAEQTRRYGNVIHNQSKRLADTVEQVLRFAGLSNDPSRARSSLSYQDVDAAALLEKSAIECQSELDAAGMEVECNAESDESGNPLLVRGDAGALGHCLRNLLSNAAKHGVHRSQVPPSWDRSNTETLDAQALPAVQLTVRPAMVSPDQWVEILVKDNGPGIAPVDLPHIFDPFYRGRRATDDQIQGTGLGLSLAKKIVEAHNGSIQVSSQSGEGTTFNLRLPRAAAQSTPGEGKNENDS
ncbi:MAG: HAMP domain-containing sensor histidine kinase [Acidobacteriota bacterium]